MFSNILKFILFYHYFKEKTRQLAAYKLLQNVSHGIKISIQMKIRYENLSVPYISFDFKIKGKGEGVWLKERLQRKKLL